MTPIIAAVYLRPPSSEKKKKERKWKCVLGHRTHIYIYTLTLMRASILIALGRASRRVCCVSSAKVSGPRRVVTSARANRVERERESSPTPLLGFTSLIRDPLNYEPTERSFSTRYTTTILLTAALWSVYIYIPWNTILYRVYIETTILYNRKCFLKLYRRIKWWLYRRRIPHQTHRSLTNVP